MSTHIQIRHTDPHTEEAYQLIAELSAELGVLYGDDGSGAFSLDDVTVPRAAFVIAYLDHEVAGCGALRPMTDPIVAEIKRVYVRPAMRGKGISRRIMSALETKAGEFGYTTLRLETGIYQPEAIGLYESSGYRRIDCYGEYKNEDLSVCFEKEIQR